MQRLCDASLRHMDIMRFMPIELAHGGSSPLNFTVILLVRHSGLVESTGKHTADN
jgi:hypothetical protein